MGIVMVQCLDFRNKEYFNCVCVCVCVHFRPVLVTMTIAGPVQIAQLAGLANLLHNIILYTVSVNPSSMIILLVFSILLQVLNP